MKQAWLTLALALLAILCWQEWRVRQAQASAVDALRAAAAAEQPIQVDDSTTVTRGLEGVLLERDASIQRLTRALKAATRAQVDLRLRLDLAGEDLPNVQILVDSVRQAPAAGGLTHFEVPFVLVDEDSMDGICASGTVSLDQPGSDWLPSLTVRLDRLQVRAGVAIDLMEGPDGWRAITRTSSPALSAGITLAAQPRKPTWRDRFHPLAGLGVRDGHPEVLAGARLDPWGAVVSVSAGAVGVFVFKAF
ncbi:MAG: hypothetical protein Q8O14_12715 [bacterium]|nr:hypothetical protein [bacterium]